MDDFRRPIEETLLEMEESVREEHALDAVLIQNGFFYESYLDSATYLHRVLGYKTAIGLYGQLMTGAPPGSLKTCIVTIEGQGGRVGVLEQVEKIKTKMLRELKYVTGHSILNIDNLKIEYLPDIDDSN